MVLFNVIFSVCISVYIYVVRVVIQVGGYISYYLMVGFFVVWGEGISCICCLVYGCSIVFQGWFWCKKDQSLVEFSLVCGVGGFFFRRSVKNRGLEDLVLDYEY